MGPLFALVWRPPVPEFYLGVFYHGLVALVSIAVAAALANNGRISVRFLAGLTVACALLLTLTRNDLVAEWSRRHALSAEEYTKLTQQQFADSIVSMFFVALLSAFVASLTSMSILRHQEGKKLAARHDGDDPRRSGGQPAHLTEQQPLARE